MPYYDSEAADRAVRALWNWSKRTGGFWQQPNRHDTVTKRAHGRTVVEVRAGHNLLAEYAELPSGRLKRLR